MTRKRVPCHARFTCSSLRCLVCIVGPSRSLVRRERRIILLIQCHKSIQVVLHGTHMRWLALATLRKMGRTCIYKLLRDGEKRIFACLGVCCHTLLKRAKGPCASLEVFWADPTSHNPCIRARIIFRRLPRIHNIRVSDRSPLSLLNVPRL